MCSVVECLEVFWSYDFMLVALGVVSHGVGNGRAPIIFCRFLQKNRERSTGEEQEDVILLIVILKNLVIIYIIRYTVAYIIV